MITKKDVQHIAKLARLGLAKNEEAKFEEELASILDYFEKIKEVDISQVEPTTHSVFVNNVMREDKAKKEKPETIKKLLEAVPEKEKGYVRVKAVL